MCYAMLLGGGNVASLTPSLRIQMSRDFDHIAKQLWFMDHEAARLVAVLNDKDRSCVERSLLALYGVSIHLTGSESDIKAAIEKVRRV
jgi:hypothetical protein